MAEYVCPFCKAVIEDGVEALVEHRKPNGECDRRQLARNPQLAQDPALTRRAGNDEPNPDPHPPTCPRCAVEAKGLQSSEAHTRLYGCRFDDLHDWPGVAPTPIAPGTAPGRDEEQQHGK